MAEGLLLTPYFQTEVGIVFYRVPKDVSPAAFGERTLLQPAPTDLATVKSGKVANFSANLTACKELTAFAKAQAVRKRLNERDKPYGDLPYQRFVKSIQTCQCRDGKYCHPEKTQVETENGMVQLCWHHDRLRMEDKIGADCLAEIADKNWELFIAQTIRQTLGKQDKTIEFSDLVLFALIKGLINELDSDRLQRFLKYPDLPESSVTKESSIGFDVPNAKVNVENVGREIKAESGTRAVRGVSCHPEITAV